MITPPSGNGSYVLWGGQAPVPSGQKRGQSPRGSWPGSRPPTGPHAQTRGQTWRVVDERVDMTGLAAGAGIDEKMRGAVVVGNQGIEKMIPAAEIPRTSFVGPQSVGELVPTSEIEVGRWHGGAQQPPATTTIGNRETPPVRLACQNRGASGEGGLAGACNRQEDDVLRVQSVRVPGVKRADGLGG